MKAVLIIDMPVNCSQCPCYEDYDCNVLNECIFDEYGNPRDIECPLKPMPEKIEVNYELDYEAYYQMGWNDCLEEIEKNESVP